MNGAALVAIAAAVGNMLQGWDNATIAGAVLYIKKEFNLQTQPTIEGLIVAMSLIGATVITTFSGPVSDSVGRRPMLIISSILYFLSGLVMFWAPNVYTLLLARLLDGFGIGLSVTLVPVYISETAPPEIRGLLNTLPQFTGCTGMFLSYCMVFKMSLADSPDWRLMLGVLSIPSLLYFALTAFYLPESPRWLVSKGRMKEAKRVLQQLRGKEDVAGEMALLCEGLGSGGETSVEEYEVAPDNDTASSQDQKDYIKLYGVEDQSWVAKPARGQSSLGLISRHGSQMVNLFGSVHEKMNRQGSTLFPTLSGSALSSGIGSMLNVNEQGGRNEWDEDREKYPEDITRAESEDTLKSPLLSRQITSGDVHANSGSMVGGGGEQIGGVGIGGGWQLAYKKDEKKDGGLKKVYLCQGMGSKQGSMMMSFTGGNASALVSKSVLKLDDITGQSMIGDVEENPSGSVPKRSIWEELSEPGVKHALVVGVGMQILQQFSGINGVLYYTPQILEQAGVGVLLKDLGLRSDSSSFLISSLTTLLMLPSIGVAMRLMDIAGRRWLLLATLPVLLTSLVTLVLGSVIKMSSTVHAVISTVSVIVYFCTFVMGFGPIPNILCAEIFPTRVRGICIAICALTFWIGDIIVTYSLPIMLTTVGLSGAFGLYAIVCSIAWVFVFLKVPETKGMPLEVITEFFVVGARQELDSESTEKSN